MDQNNQEKQDISKVFCQIRAKLNEKEKELLELQRSEPSLLAPDSDQIETLFSLISSIHLSTADGSFLVPSTQDDSSIRSTVTYPSTGIQTIKTLPSKIWLKEKLLENDDDDTSALRLPLVSQLFSMSPKAFVVSPSSSSTTTTDVPSVNSIKVNEMKNDQPTNRLSMVNELLSMPIDAFKPSTKSQSFDITTNIQILPPKSPTSDEPQPKSVLPSPPPPPPPPPVPATPTTVKSIFDGDSVYSKEFWLKKPEKTTTTDESSRFDVEKYIEKTSEKMRRLHLEYVVALNQLQSPTTEFDSTSTLKSIYPQVFDRLQPSLPSRARYSQSAASTK